MFRNRKFVLICLINVLSWVSLYMLNTTIVPYAMSLGMQAGIAGVVSAAYFIASLVSRPFSGMLGDRYSRKGQFLLASVLLTAVGVGLIFAYNPVVLIALRIIQGIGYGIATTTTMALAADTLPDNQISAGIGYFGLTTVIGQMAGPAVALFVKKHYGFAFIFIISLALRIAAFVLILLIPDAQRRVQGLERRPKFQFSLWQIIERRSLLPAGVGMLFSILNSALTAFLVTHADINHIAGASLFFTISTATMFLARMLCSGYTEKRSLFSAAVFSGIFCGSTMLLLGVGRSSITLLVAGALFGIGYGTLLPVTQARSVNLPAEYRSRGSSTYYIGIDLGFSISNLIGGRLIDVVGSNTMYLLLIIPVAAAILLAWWGKSNDPIMR